MAGIIGEIAQKAQALQGVRLNNLALQQAQERQQREAQGRESLQAYYKSGGQDRDALINGIMNSPELANNVLAGIGIADKRQEEQAAADVARLWQTRSNPESFRGAVAQRIDAVMQRGGNPSDTVQLGMIYEKDPVEAETQLKGIAAALEAKGYKTGVFDNTSEGMTPYQAASLNLRQQELEAQNIARQEALNARRAAIGNEQAKADIAVDTENRKLKLQQGVKDFTTITSNRAAAGKQMNALSQLASLSPESFDGAFSGAKMFLSRAAKEAGIDISGLPESEAFAAIANEAVLGKAQQMSGALSNADMVFLQNTAPALMQTAEGRKKIIEYGTKMAQRDIEYAKAAQDFRKRKGYFDLAEFQEEFDAESKPLFASDAASVRKRQFLAPSQPQQAQQPEVMQVGEFTIRVKGGQ